jgi:diguanylate cyclase (GGDEF)-like protein
LVSGAELKLQALESDQVFTFDEAFATLVVDQSIETPNRVVEAVEADLKQALKASGEAAYRWQIETDEVVWSANAPEVLGCAPHLVSSGKMFASLLDVENVTTRYEAVMNSKDRDDGRGVPFQIEYMFRSEGRHNAKSIWLEDVGRWQAGLDGLPKVVFGTVRRIDDRHRRDQHLNFLGNCDPLTGMMNRGRMTEALGEAITVARKSDGSCAFAIASVSNLPTVNEAYGFDVADEVIVAVGRRLRQVMRVGDGIARYSGGKFGIILNECGEAELLTALERFVSVVRDSVIETEHGPVWAMLSMGALCLPKEAGDANVATCRAEEALNEAAKLPSDGFVIYKPSERRTTERKLNARCATEIVKCLKEDRFKLAFQPIICAKTGDVALHEALLRMVEGEQGDLIAASHLIPVAEHLGLVRLIDRSVMQKIVQTLHAYPQSKLTMNVSGTTATDPHWYGQLLEVINENAVIAPRLTVEITETVALSDLKSTRNFVDGLRKAGCGVAIDDFGAGYTSFRNLRELPVTMLKLDGTFCGNLRKNKDNEYMVRSLLDLSQKFNLKTVAEWVEQEDDAEDLKTWGVDYLQGHLYGAANVVPPWQEQAPNTFSMNDIVPEHVPEVPASIFDFAEPQEDQLVEPFELLSVDAIELAEVEQDIADNSEVLEIELTSGDLDFGDIDSSIANLRATLRDLDTHTKVSEATRDAA